MSPVSKHSVPTLLYIDRRSLPSRSNSCRINGLIIPLLKVSFIGRARSYFSEFRCGPTIGSKHRNRNNVRIARSTGSAQTLNYEPSAYSIKGSCDKGSNFREVWSRRTKLFFAIGQRLCTNKLLHKRSVDGPRTDPTSKKPYVQASIKRLSIRSKVATPHLCWERHRSATTLNYEFRPAKETNKPFIIQGQQRVRKDVKLRIKRPTKRTQQQALRRTRPSTTSLALFPSIMTMAYGLKGWFWV